MVDDDLIRIIAQALADAREKGLEDVDPDSPDGSQFDDVLGRFCYKNQCNTIIETGETRITRRVNPESLICGSISTGA